MHKYIIENNEITNTKGEKVHFALRMTTSKYTTSQKYISSVKKGRQLAWQRKT